MGEKNTTTIILKENSRLCDVIITEGDGSERRKKLSVKQVVESFQLGSEEEYFAPVPLFNSHERTVPGLLYGSTGKECKGLFFIPAEVRFMDVAGEKSNIPYPSILFYIKTTDGRLDSSRCFAVKEKNLLDLKPESEVYAFPFGNVRSNDGGICWGNNKLPLMYGYQEMRTAITMFFCSESNMDYVNAGHTFKGFKSYQEFLGALKKLKEFPENSLVKSPYVGTIEELLNYIKN